MSQGLRLTCGVLLAALALLTVVPTPVPFLWLPSVLATEFGYGFATAALLLFLPGWRRSRAGILGALLAIAAIVLFVRPMVRARDASRTLPDLLTANFGNARRPVAEFENGARSAPLVWTELVRPVQSTPVRFERRAFKSPEGRHLAVDIYHPSYPHGLLPGVLIIHGERWHSRTEHVALNGYLAARNFVVASIGEHLGPDTPFLEARDDVIVTIAYLKANATKLGLDGNRLAILGRSLGGHLGLLIAYTVSDPGIRGAISLYAPTDFQHWYATTEEDTIGTRAVLRAYLGEAPEGAREIYDAASPISFVRSSTPPTLLIHGMRDNIVPSDQSERLAARLQQEGIRHVLVRLPWATHGCDKSFAGPCGQMTTYAIERFLNAVMTDRTAPATHPRHVSTPRRVKEAKTS